MVSVSSFLQSSIPVLGEWQHRLMQSRATAPSNPGLVRFLSALERRYGKINDLIKPRPVITTKTLQLHDLQQVGGGPTMRGIAWDSVWS